MARANTAKEALQEFTVWLETERRASGKTIEAYRRDIANFIAFLVEHLGQEPHVSDLARLSRHDVIAWLAKRRSVDNLAGSSRARAASSLRAFFRFLVRRGILAGNPARAVRSPKRRKPLPRALDVDDTFRLVEAPTVSGKGTGDGTDGPRRAALREVQEHLSRDLLRVRAHALGRDAVVGGRDDHGRLQRFVRDRAADRRRTALKSTSAQVN